MNVEAATRVFGSPLRVQLLRYYREHPGSQRDAADELGLAHRSVGHNLRILVEAGVVTATAGEDRRERHYEVDDERVQGLFAALQAFTLGRQASGAGDESRR